MNHLLRSVAPLSDEAWSVVDGEARERLAPALAVRKLVDFSGPLGWRYSATSTGRVEPVPAPLAGLVARRRVVVPVVELRAPFALSLEELSDAARGALDVDLGPLDDAAQAMAQAENVALVHGWPDAQVRGIAEASPHPPIALGEDFSRYPERVAAAVATLAGSGVAGPYGLALGPEGYTGVVESTERGGLVVFDHLREILGGPILRAPGVRGAVVVSLRGGDFLFESGEDLSIGYDHHDDRFVHLYLEESFSFRVVSPDAAVALHPAS